MNPAQKIRWYWYGIIPYVEQKPGDPGVTSFDWRDIEGNIYTFTHSDGKQYYLKHQMKCFDTDAHNSWILNTPKGQYGYDFYINIPPDEIDLTEGIVPQRSITYEYDTSGEALGEGGSLVGGLPVGKKYVFVLDTPFFTDDTENPGGSLFERFDDTSLTSLGNNYFMFDVPEPEPEPDQSQNQSQRELLIV